VQISNIKKENLNIPEGFVLLLHENEQTIVARNEWFYMRRLFTWRAPVRDWIMSSVREGGKTKINCHQVLKGWTYT